MLSEDAQWLRRFIDTMHVHILLISLLFIFLLGDFGDFGRFWSGSFWVILGHFLSLSAIFRDIFSKPPYSRPDLWWLSLESSIFCAQPHCHSVLKFPACGNIFRVLARLGRRVVGMKFRFGLGRLLVWRVCPFFCCSWLKMSKKEQKRWKKRGLIAECAVVEWVNRVW